MTLIAIGHHKSPVAIIVASSHIATTIILYATIERTANDVGSKDAQGERDNDQ